jgi:zinc protease
MRFIQLSLFLFFSCCFAVSAANAKTFNAETFTLENGLQVIVIPNHRAPVVTHMIWYKFGGGDEKIGESGVAHFLEHLMFKGTPKIPDGQFSKIVKKLGGNDNAFTSHDYTAYYQNIAKASLDRVMEMESDRMKNLILKDSEVLSERQVIIEERRQRIDNQPQAKFQEQLMSTLFVNHPYGTPVIGWLSEMQELTREEAMSYYSKWYAPNNAVLIVSGDITADELKPLAEKYYGVIKPSVLPKRIRPRPAPISVQHRIIMEDPRVGPPVISKTYRAPRGSDAAEIMSEILGGDSTSRLYKDLVVEQKLAINAGAEYDPISLNDTTFTIYASPTPDTSLNQLETAIDDEVKKMLDKGITLEELLHAKGKKQASLTYYLDSLQGPAILFGRAMADGFDMDYLEDWNSRIEKLSIEDIKKATAVVFAEDNLPVTGILLPQQKPSAEKGGKN